MGIVITDEKKNIDILIPNVDEILFVASHPKTRECLITFKSSSEHLNLEGCDFHHLADMIRKAQTCKED